MDVKRIVAFFLVVIVAFGVIIGTSPNMVKNLRLGLDLKGGFEILYKATPIDNTGKVTKSSLKETALALEQRANAYGVSEPNITTEGTNRIRVQLAGVKNEQQLRNVLAKPARLEFKSSVGCKNAADFCKVEMVGSDFVPNGASVGYDNMNNPDIIVKVKDKQKLAKVSTKLVGKQLAIYLDSKQLSAPVVQEPITNGTATITGNFTLKSAQNLKNVINLGALPLNLSEMYTQRVGPALGQLSLKQTVKAGLIGAIIILLFMIAMYRIPGIIASITLIVYTWLLLAVFYLMNATLTLPGIAAFVLGIGMAVDANIITYERIKEEIRSGKTILSSLKAGSRNSFRTIIDANVTTIIAGVALYYIGTGTIQGFALTLIFSIIVSILTNVFLSRLLISLLIRGSALKKPKQFGVKEEEITDISHDGRGKKQQDIRMPIDLIAKRKIFFWISGTITVLGILTLLIFNLNYGVDFTSGTVIDADNPTPITKQQVFDEVKKTGLPISMDNITVGGTNNSHVTVRFVHNLNSADEHKVTSLFGNGNVSVSTVDPTIALQLRNLAIYAVLVACLLIIIYVSIRFEWRFALAAIIALLHDAFIVVSLFSIFRFTVNLPFVAAVLTIIGYSINDTIVIFDRIRENLRFAKLKSFDQICELVNKSVWQTMARSINTIITVLVGALCLFIFGSPSIRLFSLAMIFGLISGGYSSIFIASPVWILLRSKFAPKNSTIK